MVTLVIDSVVVVTPEYAPPFDKSAHDPPPSVLICQLKVIVPFATVPAPVNWTLVPTSTFNEVGCPVIFSSFPTSK